MTQGPPANSPSSRPNAVLPGRGDPAPTAPASATPEVLTDGSITGLSNAVVELLEQAGPCLDRGQLAQAERLLARALALAPEHPEVLRLHGIFLYRSGRHPDAVACLLRALAQWPNDATIHNDLGDALLAANDADGALAVWRQACERAPGSAVAWFNLGRNLILRGNTRAATEVLERAVALAPDLVPARVMLGTELVYLGRIDDGAAQYREALRRDPRFGAAWWSLANIKTVRLDQTEVDRLAQLFLSADLDTEQRIPIGFALGKAYEDHGRYADALEVLTQANLLVRRRMPWSAQRFRAHSDAVIAAFSTTVAQARSPDLGHEVMFLVGLPRSGSTLTEQILAAHPLVEGANELSDLALVLQEESAARRERFPGWVGATGPDDWERMGRRYLDLTARWREQRPRFTDKMPNNWLFVGAALAMLPGARVVNCRRDPLETCWSGFKQLFSIGYDFTYDLTDIAAYWRDYDRASQRWLATYPGRVREQVYEALLDDPETQTRQLLEFCNLPFDPACLRFYAAGRSVRTASAAQVREPLRRDTARAQRYGELLAPLRRLLSR